MSEKLEGIMSVAMLTPMGDPNDNDCRWGAPILLEGPPGIGKSGMIGQAARSVDLPLRTVYLGQRQPEDLSGAPMPDGKGGVNIECILPAVRELTALGKGLLLLDELSCARPATQGAGLSTVQERAVGDTMLPGRVRVFAAANPPEQSAGGWKLAPPMENRLVHFKVEAPTPEEWGAYMLRGRTIQVKNLTLGEARVAEKWAESWAYIVGLTTTFIARFKPEDQPDIKDSSGKSLRDTRSALMRFPTSNDRNREHAWASPRSWEMAMRCAATCWTLSDSNVSFKILAADFVKACVGGALATAWAEWIAKADLPDPAHMLHNGWKPNKSRLDIVHAALAAATAYALALHDKDERRKHVILAYKLLNQADKEGLADMTLAPAKALMEAGYRASTAGTDKELAEAAMPLTKKFGTTGMAAFAPKN